ncbi:mitochondrial import receptor subunit TOM9-2 [Argentina anserina]|uniref:mitochondrial import receptor subunit TOM9-2 n=1 Tax=Argentina anserina TaxID=57926 RepID=UPI00217672A7|nr:mitochondrial import receptor subunit TOM9-2 [Potentilla anserina]
MASQARKGGVSLPERRNPKKDDGGPGILAKISQSKIVARGKQYTSDTSFVVNKLIKSTGRAAWILSTTFLILVVPLIIEMDRDQQLTELELQQANILGTPPSGAAPALK